MSKDEKVIQKNIIKFLESEGFYVRKSIAMNRAGFPDIYALKNGKPLHLEVKKPNGRLTELQNYNLNDIREHGGFAYKVDNLQDVKDLVNELY